MRRRNSACWIFELLLVLPALVSWPGKAAAIGSVQLPRYQVAAAEYLRGYQAASPPPATRHGPMLAFPFILPEKHAPHMARYSWFRIQFHVPHNETRRFSVYLTYISPNAAIYLNGALIGTSEGYENAGNRPWNYPIDVALPAALMRGGENALLLQINCRYFEFAKIGAVMIGPEAALYPRYQRQRWLQVTGVEIVSVLVGLIGAFTAMLWLRRRTEPIFGLFALTCALWIVRNSQFYMVRLPVTPFHFDVITDAALFWLVAILYKLSFRIMERPLPRIEAGFTLYALVTTIAMYAAGPAHKGIVTSIAYLLLVPCSALYLTYLSATVIRRGTALLWLLWLASVVTAASAAYDLLLMLRWVRWPGTYLMPYSALFYSATVGWALIDRFVATHNAYERLNKDLELRVQERERQLGETFEHNAALARERAVAAERDRILRDMHDGLGLHLISSIRLAEKGSLTREQTTTLLTEAMDELRIAIDSMKPATQELLVMLGNLRYRLEPRLAAAGIALEWNVGHGPALGALEPKQVTEITRVVQEALSNAMKHSHATLMRLSVSTTEEGCVTISVIDNGRGFAERPPHQGEGFNNMRKRAASIGASLEIHAEAGAAGVVLTVPPAAAT